MVFICTANFTDNNAVLLKKFDVLAQIYNPDSVLEAAPSDFQCL